MLWGFQHESESLFILPLNKKWPNFFSIFRISLLLYYLASTHYCRESLDLLFLRTDSGRKESHEKWAPSQRSPENELLIYVSDSIETKLNLPKSESLFWLYLEEIIKVNQRKKANNNYSIHIPKQIYSPRLQLVK